MAVGWSRTTRYLALVIVLVGAVWLLVVFRALIGPLVIAALLAYVLNPAVTLVKTRTRLRHYPSVILVYLLLLALLVAALATLVLATVNQAPDSPLNCETSERNWRVS